MISGMVRKFRKEKVRACVQREFPNIWQAARRPLFHRTACQCGESDYVAGCVDVGNISLKELVHFEPAAGVSRQSSSFQMKLIAIGLAADRINESVALYFLAALQFRGKNAIARRVDPNAAHPLGNSFRQPKRDTELHADGRTAPRRFADLRTPERLALMPISVTCSQAQRSHKGTR